MTTERNPPLIAARHTRLSGPPTPAGYWCVGEWTRIGLLHRPNRLQRLMARWLLGWEWRDAL